jgi:hypothetical protein
MNGNFWSSDPGVWYSLVRITTCVINKTETDEDA